MYLLYRSRAAANTRCTPTTGSYDGRESRSEPRLTESESSFPRSARTLAGSVDVLALLPIRSPAVPSMPGGERGTVRTRLCRVSKRGNIAILQALLHVHAGYWVVGMSCMRRRLRNVRVVVQIAAACRCRGLRGVLGGLWGRAELPPPCVCQQPPGVLGAAPCVFSRAATLVDVAGWPSRLPLVPIP